MLLSLWVERRNYGVQEIICEDTSLETCSPSFNPLVYSGLINAIVFMGREKQLWCVMQCVAEIQYMPMSFQVERSTHFVKEVWLTPRQRLSEVLIVISLICNK